MMRSFLTTFCLAPILGCGLIYDFDEFRGADVDAGTPDVDPRALLIDAIDPPIVFEGEGCIPDDGGESPACALSSPGVVVVLRGQNLNTDTVTLTFDDDTSTAYPTTASADGKFLAFIVTFPVVPGVETDREVDVRVNLDDGRSESVPLTLRGLPELELDGNPIATDLSGLYSRVILSGELNVGSAAAPLAALDIRSTTTIDISEGAIVDASYAGGCPLEGSSCEERAGRDSVTSGGGGGNLSDGGDSAGSASTAEMLVPLSAASGGRGGNGVSGGVPGGSGGGTLSLYAGHTLIISGTIRAVGEDGANGVNGAGGGAGGAVLLRSESAITLTGGVIDVVGGDGGSGTPGGGVGSLGQIRLDAPMVVEGSVTDPLRGAAWGTTTRIFTEAATQTFTLQGKAGTEFYLRVNGALEPTAIEMTADSHPQQVELQAGRNQLCAQVNASGGLTAPESLNCINVAYIP